MNKRRIFIPNVFLKIKKAKQFFLLFDKKLCICQTHIIDNSISHLLATLLTDLIFKLFSLYFLKFYAYPVSDQAKLFTITIYYLCN